jgi:hypothetical protein
VRPIFVSIAVTWLAGCTTPEAPASATAAASVPVVTTAPSLAPSVSAAPVAAEREMEKPYPCGELSCRDFPTAARALTVILEETKPAIVAFGESHALKGTEGVKSTTARFTEDLVPLFKDKASALILELWAPDPKCSKEKVKAVEQKQKVVTEKQSGQNQNEFVKLGERSKAEGIVPFLLKPTCEDFDKIQRAGDDAVMVMLDVVTRNVRDKTTALFAETEKKAPGKMVLTYGGALHNDLVPRKGREAWSYAADLDRLAPGRYVEVDLVVPEFIKDTETWKSLPWYGAYDRERAGDRVVVVGVAPRAYVIVFAPSSRRSAQ